MKGKIRLTALLALSGATKSPSSLQSTSLATGRFSVSQRFQNSASPHSRSGYTNFDDGSDALVLIVYQDGSNDAAS